MPRHRELNVQVFVGTLPVELLERYLHRLQVEHVEENWLHLNPERLMEYLGEAEHAVTAAIIREDIRRINDICQEAMGLLVRAYRKFLIPFDAAQPRAELAMRLFLDHPDAFDFAWSRFLLFASSSRLSVHYIPADTLEYGSAQEVAFERGVRDWFTALAKGEQCTVSFFEENGEQVLLIRHGSYVRTVSYWEGDRLSTQSYRPALEDVLVYEPDTQLLRVKASLQKDREEYLRLWCRWIAGNDALTEPALQTEVFSLAPLQDGSFDFGGDGPILGVQLRRVTLKLFAGTNAVLQLKADEVREVFEYGPEGLDLGAGLLVAARLRFLLQPPNGRVAQVTFDIEPPLRTTLVEKCHADLILRYLEQQHIKLR